MITKNQQLTSKNESQVVSRQKFKIQNKPVFFQEANDEAIFQDFDQAGGQNDFSLDMSTASQQYQY